MKKIIVLGLCFLFFASLSGFAAELTVAERELKGQKIPVSPEKARIIISSDTDYGWVSLDSKVGVWKAIINRVSVSLPNGISPYVESVTQDRFGLKNYEINYGSYFNFKDNSYLRSEIGWGADIDYVYRFETTQEYGHRLYKNLYWQAGYRFLNYADNDVYIMNPGIFYYFGDHFVNLFYNISFTEGRGAAQWGTLKGNFSLFDNRLNFWVGTAVGERLYDIDPIKARKQFGYIAFIGANYNICKNLDVRLGYSYSSEDPDFMKRSLDFGCSLKF